jgi:hypothetical protein
MKPRRNPRKKPAIPTRTKLARSPQRAATLNPDHLVTMRDLFWQNVLREMLTSLSIMSQQLAAAESQAPSATDAQAESAPPPDPATLPDPSLFDGRLGIVTKGGDRIAIASIIPLHACGSQDPLAAAIECTIFQVRTPDGHVFTLPIQEIRAFHALSPEVMARLEETARRRAARREQAEDSAPFGFAAFTSLTRGTLPPEPPPAHPME